MTNLQEHDFSKSTLSVRGILKCVEDLFQRYHLPGLLVYRFPDDTISLQRIAQRRYYIQRVTGNQNNNTHPFAELRYDFVFTKNVLVDVLAHFGSEKQGVRWNLVEGLVE